VTESKRIEELRRRVQKDPASLAFAPLAEELRRAGELQEAIRVCRTGLAQHPEYLSARVTLGRALLASDQLDAAFTELSTALAAAPENLAALRGLADIQHRRGELHESLELYRRALALAPQDPDLAAAVAALEPTAAQTWQPEPAPSLVPPAEALPTQAAAGPSLVAAEPAPATEWQAAAPEPRPAADSADPSPDFASQQASLAAFYGEPHADAEPESESDWLASLDAAAANILAADARREAEIESIDALPAALEPGVVEPAIVEPAVVEPSPVETAALEPGIAEATSVEPAVDLEIVPSGQIDLTEWTPEVIALPAAPAQPPEPDPEAARAEVLQRWLDAILASRSGQPSADDRA
jgi:tetratricopeptide (TPR) repeat protein